MKCFLSWQLLFLIEKKSTCRICTSSGLECFAMFVFLSSFLVSATCKQQTVVCLLHSVRVSSSWDWFFIHTLPVSRLAFLFLLLITTSTSATELHHTRGCGSQFQAWACSIIWCHPGSNYTVLTQPNNTNKKKKGDAAPEQSPVVVVTLGADPHLTPQEPKRLIWSINNYWFENKCSQAAEQEEERDMNVETE